MCTESGVNAVQETAETIEGAGREITQGYQKEPWGQETFRVVSVGGSVLAFAETPWARRIAQRMEAAAGDA